MLRSMYTSITGLRNHQTMLDTVAGNISNVNTYGYKSQSVTFRDLVYQTLQGTSAPSTSLGGTNARQVGLGMQIDSITQRHTQGALQTTGVISDMAIQGDGFFAVTNDGTNLTTVAPYSTPLLNPPPLSYQRAGNFSLDNNGDLVTSDGYFVVGVAESGVTPGTPNLDGSGIAQEYKRLRIDPATTRSWSVGSDGRVTRIVAATGALETIGWVMMGKFANPAGLQMAGSNKWTVSSNSGAAQLSVASNATTGMGAITSGALEMSNVDLAAEFTEMIRAQRGFQANSRIITTSDEILQELVNLKR